jgi:predicted MFS family arabinose efflux permease
MRGEKYSLALEDEMNEYSNWMRLLNGLDDALPGGSARRPVLMLALGAFALGTDAFVISGVLPKIASDLGVTLPQAGLLITVFSGVYAFAAPIMAVVTGTTSRRRLLMASLACFTAANVLAAVAPSFAIMIVARAAAALVAGLYMPAASATAATVAPISERGRALAAVLSGLTVATALGVPLGTLIGQALNWRYTFLFVAALSTVAWGALARALPPVPPAPIVSISERLAAIAIPGVLGALTVTAVAVMGVFSVYTYMAWFASETAHIEGISLTVIYFVFGVCAVASNLLSGWLIDRHPPRRVVTLSLTGMVIVFGALWLFSRATLPRPTAVVILTVLVACWAVVGWMFAPAQQKRLLQMAGPVGTIVLSLNSSAIYLGQAAAGILGGALLTRGPRTLTLVAAGCEVAAMVIFAITIAGQQEGAPGVSATAVESAQHWSD